jgi:hypothetical protein
MNCRVVINASSAEQKADHSRRRLSFSRHDAVIKSVNDVQP